MTGSVSEKLQAALGAHIVKARPLSGGDIADVSLLTLDDGRQVVAKRPRMDQPDTTATEKMMLNHLMAASALPVPEVLFQSKGILVISYLPHAGATDAEAAARDIASHVAKLHDVQPKKGTSFYGFEKDTFIGPLPQQNKALENWCDFFVERRLLAMAGSATRTGKLSQGLMTRIEAFAAKIEEFLPKRPSSSLLHGDLWAGNILIDGDRAAGFIDPAISYGHAEMDLAFIDLMGGLAPTFFEAYNDFRPLDTEYQSTRKPIYQLWPLLVHVRLFGGGYVGQVDTILSRLGF